MQITFPRKTHGNWADGGSKCLRALKFEWGAGSIHALSIVAVSFQRPNWTHIFLGARRLELPDPSASIVLAGR